MRYQAMAATVSALVLFPIASFAQSPCGSLERLEKGETIAQLADRCDVSEEAVMKANDLERGAEPEESASLKIPPENEGRDWLGEARNAVEDAGNRIGDAASQAGRSAAQYLSDQPDLNQEIIDFGEKIGIPGFQAEPVRGAWLEVESETRTDIRIRASGLPGNEEVEIGWMVEKDFMPVGTVTTTDQGRLDITMGMHSAIPVGDPVRFVLRTTDDKLRLATDLVKL